MMHPYDRDLPSPLVAVGSGGSLWRRVPKAWQCSRIPSGSILHGTIGGDALISTPVSRGEPIVTITYTVAR